MVRRTIDWQRILSLCAVWLCVSAQARADGNVTQPETQGDAHAHADAHAGARAMDADADADADAQARTLFEQAAELHERWRLEEAIALYREALHHRQHPQIYLNLARALEKYGDLLAAHRNVQRALEANPRDALSDEQSAIAAQLESQLEARLARIEVLCDEPGAEVFVDGKPWPLGAGAHASMVLVGEHVIIAKKPGFFTVTRSQPVMAGQSMRVTVHLERDPGHLYQRRWHRALPLTTLATGSAFALAGGWFLRDARNQYRNAADTFDHGCTLSCGSQVGAEVRDAVTTQRWGAAALAIGSTVALTGLVMLVLNQPQPYQPSDFGGAEFRILPMRGSRTAGVSASWRF